MKKVFRFVATYLLLILTCVSPVFAMGDYTYSNTYTESYNSTSSTGSFVSFGGAVPNYVPNYYNQCGCVHCNQGMHSDTNGYYQSSIINTPQGYNKQITNTQTFRDERPEIDKNIDRSARVVGILGTAAVFGLGIAALICSF